MDDLTELNRTIALAINQMVGRIDRFDSSVFILADMSLLKLTGLVALLWALWFRGLSDVESDRRVLAKAVIGVGLSMVLARLLQNLLPRRVRPINADLPDFRHINIDPERIRQWTDWSSMPSDHAVVAFALSTAIYLWHRGAGALAFAWSIVMICAPRVYLGRHFPGDIIVGATIGVTVVCLCARTRLLDGIGDRILALEKRAPIPFYVVAFVAAQQTATMFGDLRHIAGSIGRLISVAAAG